MSTSITCPNCRVALRLTDQMLGRNLQCPKCGQALLVRGQQHAGPPGRKGLLLVLLLLGALLALGGGTALVLVLLSGDQPDKPKPEKPKPPVVRDRDQKRDAATDPKDRQGQGEATKSIPQDKLHLLPPDAETPVITYFFHGNLSPEEKNAPDLIPTDPLRQNGFENAQVLGLRKQVYRFTGNATPVDQQAGLTFDNSKGLLPSDQYSVELVLMFLEGDGRWRRIVDVQDRQSDDGFYADPFNHLQVYPLPGKGNLITAGGYHHVVLTVAKTGTVKAYLDGSIQFTGETRVMFIDNPKKVMHFFLDNVVGPGQGEFSNGKVAVIRLYNRVLSDAKVSRLADWVRGTKAPAAEAPAEKDVVADPGTLGRPYDQVGKTHYFRVTGSTTGSIWGTDVYTADSSLATASVHAGALRAGETGVVRVKVVAGLGGYTGSTRNGVTSGNWDAWPVAYTISRAGPVRKGGR
jgi:hypothetical protein